MVTFGAASRFVVSHIAVERGLSSMLCDVDPSSLGTPTKTLPPPVDDLGPERVEVLTAAGWGRVATLPLGAPELGFRGRTLRAVDLGSLSPGKYILRHQGVASRPVFVAENALLDRTLGAVLGYFRSQRSAGPWDAQDRAVPFFGGREGTVDVHGGWYDASGDVSKYLSHLSYANFMNPQQTPIVVWGLLDHYESRAGHHAPGVADALLDEAAHGAEFLERMLDPAGFFYMTVFDQWSKKLERRVICAYRGKTGELLPGYQAGYRQGAGASIAALARAGRVLGRPHFLAAAVRAFDHLETHNLEYLDDGKENVIDDYTALLAAAELFRSTGEDGHRRAAERRAASLARRIQTGGPHPGWLAADDGDRPFFHAAEAGLPALALLRLATVLEERAALDEQAPRGAPDDHTNTAIARLEAAASALLDFELWVTESAPNPFGYARQYTVSTRGERKLAFFIPHDNETGYWWQGENARLASLAAAAGALAARLERAPQATSSAPVRGELVTRLRRYGHAQLDWICGKNPFDACMLHGFGEGGGNYLPEWSNVVGGICNGITSSFDDESDVDFGRPELAGDHGWRWHEQWIPHAAWYLIALGRLATG